MFYDLRFINFNFLANHSEFERMLTFVRAHMPGHYFLGLILSICFLQKAIFPISLRFFSNHYFFHYDSTFFNVIHCFSCKIILRKLFSFFDNFLSNTISIIFFQTDGSNFLKIDTENCENELNKTWSSVSNSTLFLSFFPFLLPLTLDHYPLSLIL